jgi:hypothetical protein
MMIRPKLTSVNETVENKNEMLQFAVNGSTPNTLINNNQIKEFRAQSYKRDSVAL